MLHVNAEDLVVESEWSFNPEGVQASLSEQLRLSAQWDRYIDRPSTVHSRGSAVVRRLRRLAQRLQAPPPSMVRRLANIELSHLDLLGRGIDSGADWILVIEDDGWCDDLDDLAHGILGIMAADPGPSYVNMSASFSTQQLAIDHLLRTVSTTSWRGSHKRELLSSDRPTTNTVCAILYSRQFTQELLAELEALPKEPIVPIDWKLNVALMGMFASGRFSPGTCWFVEPAPITQMSMRTTEILDS